MATTRCPTAALAAALLLLATGVEPAKAQSSSWQTYMESGQKAYKAGEYGKAQTLLESALKEAEGFGPNDPRLPASLAWVAEVYKAQGKYDQAEPLCRRSLGIVEKSLGPEHSDVGASLNNLAELYRAQGKYDEAEPLYRRSLAIRERALGPEHPDVATSLNNFAGLYCDQSKYDQAEPLYRRSLAIREKVLGPDHPDVAQSLNNLARGRNGGAASSRGGQCPPYGIIRYPTFTSPVSRAGPWLAGCRWPRRGGGLRIRCR